jgi:membrane associated rhomboid family serine protease
MNGFGRGLFGMPPVVKNLIFLNILMLLAYYAVGIVFDIDLNRTLGLYFPLSEQFKPIQILAHMFLHGGPGHLFFNMFALYMFGQALEQVWGPKRFFIFYFVCGLGAAVTHETVIAFQYNHLVQSISSENMQIFLNNGTEFINNGDINSIQKLYDLLHTPTVGASGAIFGVLLAFGVLFPNTQLMLLFPPIPIKAKYFVAIYGGIELYMAITQQGGNIAHAAHLGGMLFGYILIRYWRKTTNTLY